MLLIATGLLTECTLVESGLRERVLVAAVLVLAVRGEERPHPGLALGGELEPQPVVDPPDRGERVRHERVEVDVHDLVRPHGPVLARGHGAVQALDDVLGPLGRDLREVRIVAGHAAELLLQRRDRRDDAQRVAVRLHEQCVRVLGEECVEAPDVRGRLQQPAVRRHGIGGMARLQVLEEEAVPPVCGCHVRLVHHPAGVRRDAVLRGEDHAAKVRRSDANALLREPTAHGVHGQEAGHEQLDTRELRVDLVDAGVGEVGRRLGRGDRKVHLPGQRRAAGQVLGEDVVEDRGAGARLADDDDGRDDITVGDLGMLLAPVDDGHPVPEQHAHVAGDDVDAQRVEARFLAQCIEQTLESVPPGRFTEIVEPGGFHRLGEEPVARRVPCRPSVFLPRTAAPRAGQRSS